MTDLDQYKLNTDDVPLWRKRLGLLARAYDIDILDDEPPPPKPEEEEDQDKDEEDEQDEDQENDDQNEEGPEPEDEEGDQEGDGDSEEDWNETEDEEGELDPELEGDNPTEGGAGEDGEGEEEDFDEGDAETEARDTGEDTESPEEPERNPTESEPQPEEEEETGKPGKDSKPFIPELEWTPPIFKRAPLPPADQRDFASWQDFVECAADQELFAWPVQDSHILSKYDKDWYGTATFDEAVEMALRTGWPEGRKLLSEMLTAILPKPQYYQSLEYSVAGAFPSVPTYCAGDPECMVVDPGANMRNAKPIIRIDYSTWVNCNVGANSIMLRGATVLSLANSLEHRGYQTEIRIVGAVGGWGAPKEDLGQKPLRISITFKRAGEPLDIDRAAFAMAHPAAFRRLGFAIIEQHAENYKWFSSNYGHSIQSPNDPMSGKVGGTIFVPGPTPYETAESARQAVEQAALAVLSQVNQLDAAD